MSRNIFCKGCGDKYPPTMHPLDIEDGWQERRVWQAVQKPKEHFVMVNGRRHDLESLVCDRCGAIIKDGDMGLLVTMYLEHKPVPAWEHEYAVKANT